MQNSELKKSQDFGFLVFLGVTAIIGVLDFDFYFNHAFAKVRPLEIQTILSVGFPLIINGSRVYLLYLAMQEAKSKIQSGFGWNFIGTVALSIVSCYGFDSIAAIYGGSDQNAYFLILLGLYSIIGFSLFLELRILASLKHLESDDSANESVSPATAQPQAVPIIQAPPPPVQVRGFEVDQLRIQNERLKKELMSIKNERNEIARRADESLKKTVEESKKAPPTPIGFKSNEKPSEPTDAESDDVVMVNGNYLFKQTDELFKQVYEDGKVIGVKYRKKNSDWTLYNRPQIEAMLKTYESREMNENNTKNVRKWQAVLGLFND